MKRRKRARMDDEGSREGTPDGSDGDDSQDSSPSPTPLPRVRSLVVGGSDAGPGQFPFQAGMVVTCEQDGRKITKLCGAVLLSDRWLITAAHCCQKGSNFRVFLGSYPTMQDAQQRLDTSLVLLHPLYSEKAPGHHDLALIRLPQIVRLNDMVRPVRLPASRRHRKNDFSGAVATLSGWGKTSDTDMGPSKGTAVLQYARGCIMTNKEAEGILQRKLPPHFLCYRGLRGEVSCNGDSGGPLTVEGSDGEPVLVGIVSHRYGLFCSRGKTAVCTRITSFLPWITAITKAHVND